MAAGVGGEVARSIMHRSILATYPSDCQPQSLEFLGNAGGFSGAQLWRVTSRRGLLCLRRWPSSHPSPDGLRWMHDVLAHVDRGGFSLVPVPIRSRSGSSFLLADGCLWELTPWMPGEANYFQHPRRAKLAAAMQTLARFHQAAEGWQRTCGVSRGLRQRHEFTRSLLGGEVHRYGRALSRRDDTVYGDRCEEILRRAAPRLAGLLDMLAPVASQQVTLLPCLRDIWHDHVLFQDDEVSGLIDFGAMRMETVSGDITRLLGSLVADDADLWRVGLAAYEQVRPLAPAERQLLSVFDRANIVLSGLNWVRWLTVDGRTFEDSAAVGERLDHVPGSASTGRRIRRISILICRFG